MTNRQIAEMLFNIATILDMAEDNLYRVRAYRRAARRILSLREEAAVILARGEALPLPGVGVRVRRKLAELILSGRMTFYYELLEDLPPPIASLMALEGVGPRTAERLHQELGITTPGDVAAAAGEGRIRALYGFGAVREARLAHAAQALATSPTAA
ncbi:MAG: hypothetical protein NVSMB65_18840 [Chloroflexota bacterium]